MTRLAYAGRWLAQGALLVGVSLLVGLAATEGILRAFVARYEPVEAALEQDSLRLYRRRPGSHISMADPDTGLVHPVIYNGLTLRQHREFSEEDLGSDVNLGFFGDSFVENLRVPAAETFVEVLDYLLNLDGQRFNVLNFGVSGYGTDQSYITYRHGDLTPRLDHVFYVLCANDLRNIFANDLYDLDARGGLIRRPAPESPWWIPVLSRLHVTYLLLELKHVVQLHLAGQGDRGAGDEVEKLLRDALQPVDRQALDETRLQRARDDRFESERARAITRLISKGRWNADVARTIATFQALLVAWRDRVQEQGGHFSVVLLPRPREDRFVDLVPEGIEVINLYRIFAAGNPGYSYADISFRYDNHWNQRGNLAAARALHEQLAPRLGLPRRSKDEIDAALATYYSALPGEWKPQLEVPATPAAAESAGPIRRKYLALELQDAASGTQAR